MESKLSRIDIIGQNGNDGLHYEPPDCNTCIHHMQGQHPPIDCQICLVTELSNWKPKENKVSDGATEMMREEREGYPWEDIPLVATVKYDTHTEVIRSGPTQSDGSTASYYELPKGATELQDLIACRDMNAQMGEIFRACYRYGIVKHSPKIRDIKKIIFYAQAELARLEKYGE